MLDDARMRPLSPSKFARTHARTHASIYTHLVVVDGEQLAFFGHEDVLLVPVALREHEVKHSQRRHLAAVHACREQRVQQRRGRGRVAGLLQRAAAMRN